MFLFWVFFLKLFVLYFILFYFLLMHYFSLKVQLIWFKGSRNLVIRLLMN